MPKVIRKHKIPNDKPVKKGRPPKKLNIVDDDVNELDKIQDDGNVIIKITWGPHYIEL